MLVGKGGWWWLVGRLKRKHLPGHVPLHSNPQFNKKLRSLDAKNKDRKCKQQALALKRRLAPASCAYEAGNLRQATLLSPRRLPSDDKASGFAGRKKIKVVDASGSSSELPKLTTCQTITVWKLGQSSSMNEVLEAVRTCNVVLVDSETHCQALPKHVPSEPQLLSCPHATAARHC